MRKLILSTLFLLALFAPLSFNTQGFSLHAQEEVNAQPLTQEQLLQSIADAKRPSLITQASVLAFLALLPFIIMLLTSFVKIVIVFALLRNALGVQQSPPNQVINGIGFLLSLYIMYPTALKMYDATAPFIQQARSPESLISTESAGYIYEIAKIGAEPMRQFMIKNSLQAHQKQFFRIALRLLPVEHRQELGITDYIVLIPSYITSQLKAAFEIGVLIYIPFFVIDLVTSNVLLAMGMMMLSPVTISMPLKLFLIVMLDGWTILIEGLVATFR